MANDHEVGGKQVLALVVLHVAMLRACAEVVQGAQPGVVVAGLVVGLQVVLAVGRRFEPVEVQAVLRDQELRVGFSDAYAQFLITQNGLDFDRLEAAPDREDYLQADDEIGRASCRERGEISVVAVSLKKKED